MYRADRRPRGAEGAAGRCEWAAAVSRKPRWITPDEPLPPATSADPDGLVAVGHDLSAERLVEAYGKGIFPWYSAGQPVRWWSLDPRMVVYTAEFSPGRTLRRRLRQLHDAAPGTDWSVRLDSAFLSVIRACAATPRPGQSGTWITRDIMTAYTALHRQGLAHSVEVWSGDALVGGLYGVSLGRMFYGESMFARATDASKCAFAALIDLLRRLDMPMVDCQQSTAHLRSLGGREIGRREFVAEVDRLRRLAPPDWRAAGIEWPAV